MGVKKERVSLKKREKGVKKRGVMEMGDPQFTFLPSLRVALAVGQSVN